MLPSQKFRIVQLLHNIGDKTTGSKETTQIAALALILSSGVLTNLVLFCVFRRTLLHFLLDVAPYNVPASGSWINLGAVNNLSHARFSLVSLCRRMRSVMCKSPHQLSNGDAHHVCDREVCRP